MTRVVCGEADQASDGGIQIYLNGKGQDARSGLTPLRVGAASAGEPDAVVVLAGPPARRFDVFCHRPAPMLAFEARLWVGWLALGLGDCVTLLSLADGAQREYRLDDYFSALHEAGDALLVVSASGIPRLDRDGRVIWQCGGLGIDGVIVRDITNGIIHGEGEWDPPGGWQPFTLNFATGERLERP